MLVRFSGAGFNFAAADLDFVLVSLISVRPIEQTILAESALPRWQGNPCKAGQAYGCRGSVIVGNKFLGLRVGPRTIAQMGGTQDLYWFGPPESNTLCPVRATVLFALICSRCYKLGERGTSS
jgi:hypothetical protein